MAYTHLYGSDVERDYRSPLYDAVLEDSLVRLNPGLPADALFPRLLSGEIDVSSVEI